MRRAGIISTKVFSIGSVILLSTFFLQLSSFAKAPDITVMTSNLYVGADFTDLIAASDINAFLEEAQDALDQMAANDFVERSEAWAAVIVDKNPDLIGLQEVYVITKHINANNGSPPNGSPPFLNYLDELLDALSAKGACYYEAATVTNLGFGPIYVPFYGLVSIKDQDVILARCDVDTVPVDIQSWCDRPSDVPTDVGCTYVETAETFIQVPDSPPIEIEIERGYVAVDVIGSFPVRFFNTHLEIQFPDPNNPFSAFIQSEQAGELIDLIDEVNNEDPPLGPVIVVGDINSSPVHPNIDPIITDPIITPYNQFVTAAAGYTDTWTMIPGNPKGITCCYDEDLSVPADLYERIDMIFSDVIPNQVKANVAGNDEADQTPSGLRPSDHAGVAARLEY